MKVRKRRDRRWKEKLNGAIIGSKNNCVKFKG